MIKLQNLDKTYSQKGRTINALQAINLDVAEGEVFGIIGGSGAGKSTLLRCINLLEEPSNGEVIVDQKNLRDLSTSSLRAARRKMGMIFQHFNLISTKNVFHNIALPLKLANTPSQKIKDRVQELLELTGLQGYARAYPHELSGGQKQRVAIARALAHEPKVLLSDEATSALDPQTTRSILALLQDINKKLGITIVLITHEMDVIKQICHRVAILEDGKIIEQGDVLDIFTQPEQAVTKSFVATCMKESLPSNILDNLHVTQQSEKDHPLLHLAFRGSSAVEPVISGLVKKCDVEVNILQAHLENIRGESCGAMTLSLQDAKKCDAAVAYLKQNGLQVEVLGYVTFD
jgi:D-methionine transport system ATP-binding protein